MLWEKLMLYEGNNVMKLRPSRPLVGLLKSSAKRTTSFPVRAASASEGLMRSRGSSHSPRPNHMSMRC
ncbi:putative retinal degeneration B-like [Homarus americanus]|uniref:Putative retinal degeneration B-like n=1 Tax=Homarus americanus TaxID=6706 RepID=A0A8J5TGN1_HOMAM|nr:putative retinal degeneration B-like [Homarus americanus]